MPKPEYGYQHRKERARWKPTVDAGQAWCAEHVCIEATRHITPGSKWDLAHDRVHGGYLGPAHYRCNRGEGGRYARAKHHTRRTNSRDW